MFLVYFMFGFLSAAFGKSIEIQPAISDQDEEFEMAANKLQPGDELVLHSGTYSQNGRRAVIAKGTAEHPIVIRAADKETVILTRPIENRDRQNNIEFVDCAFLIVRGLHFKGGSSGVRFIRGHHVTFEDCEIFETTNNALTMNSGNCDSFIIRRNHIHHTGLATDRATEGEGMYIGCHDGSCRTGDSLIEGNYIHHTRGTSSGGNDGIEIKAGSFGNIVRNNVIHDTNIGTKYPGVFVYGGGPTPNIVEGNAIWNAGDGIQVVSDAIVRNNIIFNCLNTGINAAPHGAMPNLRNTTIVNNTIYNAPVGVRMRWADSTNMIFANNAIYCPAGTALNANSGSATLRNNFVFGSLDAKNDLERADPSIAFVDAGATNFFPTSGSPLRGKADANYTPELDFNGDKRSVPSAIGAYGGNAKPGWKIQPGFKTP